MGARYLIERRSQSLLGLAGWKLLLLGGGVAEVIVRLFFDYIGGWPISLRMRRRSLLGNMGSEARGCSLGGELPTDRMGRTRKYGHGSSEGICVRTGDLPALTREYQVSCQKSPGRRQVGGGKKKKKRGDQRVRSGLETSCWHGQG